jgi:hypothetical protein
MNGIRPFDLGTCMEASANDRQLQLVVLKQKGDCKWINGCIDLLAVCCLFSGMGTQPLVIVRVIVSLSVLSEAALNNLGYTVERYDESRDLRIKV